MKVKPVKIDPAIIAECVERAGYVRGAKIAEFIALWSIAAMDLGHEPTSTEVAAWWKDKTPRTTYDRLRYFREAFPEYSTPGDFARAIENERRAGAGEHLRTPRTV